MDSLIDTLKTLPLSLTVLAFLGAGSLFFLAIWICQSLLRMAGRGGKKVVVIPAEPTMSNETQALSSDSATDAMPPPRPSPAGNSRRAWVVLIACLLAMAWHFGFIG